ncbi:WYL domain-containing protein, partial [Hydrogenimonas sp.]|uniref:helix-turn-helix transcriptional regulator n=1 Tax=Hydrogenimonas sp. TaxID=2231112 RepID=UPI0026391779
MALPFHKEQTTTKQRRRELYKNTTDRLAMILSRLYAGEILSMKELAQECQVSIRTIQRDINERLIDTPIRKSGEKVTLAWRESEERALSAEELAVLEMLEKLSEKQGHEFHAKAHRVLRKLKAQAANPYYFHLPTESLDAMLAKAVKFEKAIKKRRLVHCRYRMDKGNYDIDIKPLKIVNFQGYWYVLAMDARNDVVKKYLLRHCSKIRLDEEIFTPPKDIDDAISRALAIWFEPDTEPFEVRLFIDGSVAKYFERKPLAPTQRIEGKDADGSLEVVVTITHEMEIVPTIKQWLPHLRVLEP